MVRKHRGEASGVKAFGSTKIATGNDTRHHDQSVMTVSFKTAMIEVRAPKRKNPVVPIACMRR